MALMVPVYIPMPQEKVYWPGLGKVATRILVVSVCKVFSIFSFGMRKTLAQPSELPAVKLNVTGRPVATVTSSGE